MKDAVSVFLAVQIPQVLLMCSSDPGQILTGDTDQSSALLLCVGVEQGLWAMGRAW